MRLQGQEDIPVDVLKDLQMASVPVEAMPQDRQQSPFGSCAQRFSLGAQVKHVIVVVCSLAESAHRVVTLMTPTRNYWTEQALED